MTMNENQVENLLSQHGNEIEARRQPKVVKRRTTWKPILVTGTAMVAITTFLLLPRNAEAARIQGMRNALKGVQSMEYWGHIRYNGNSWNEFVHQIRQGDLVWAEIAKSRALRVTYISNHEDVMMNWERLPFVTISKANIDDFYGEDDPLKIAIANYTGNNVSEQYDVKTADSKPIDGHATYTLSYVSKEPPSNSIDKTTKDKQSFQIVVDAATNLPIESKYRREEKDVVGDIKYRYVYNRQYSQSLFKMTSQKPIIYSDKERKRLTDKWMNEKSEADFAPIYSATISPEGTIWIAFGVKNYEEVSSIPTEITGDNNVKYVIGTEQPYACQDSNSETHGEFSGVVFSPFIPIYDQSAVPKTAQIKYGLRATNKKPESDQEAKFSTVKLGLDSWNIPNYFPAFNKGRDMLTFPIDFWRSRAVARRELGDVLGAAKAFEQQAEAYKSFVEYGGYKPLLEAAKCYEILGILDKAKALRVRAAELQRTRVR